MGYHSEGMGYLLICADFIQLVAIKSIHADSACQNLNAFLGLPISQEDMGRNAHAGDLLKKLAKLHKGAVHDASYVWTRPPFVDIFADPLLPPSPSAALMAPLSIQGNLESSIALMIAALDQVSSVNKMNAHIVQMCELNTTFSINYCCYRCWL